MLSKEHPLLFTSENVKAILEDRKTQTRRVPVERYRSWKVGDMIWVKETFRYCIFMLGCGGTASGIEYKDGTIRFNKKASKYAKQRSNKDKKGQHARWRPSIHMPQWATRIFLEITGLREERVQDITQKDAIAEGCCRAKSGGLSEKAIFQTLWDSINAKRHKGIYAWNENPFCCVISFKRIDKP